jgi:ubiquinone biosynthesis protein Coq4
MKVALVETAKQTTAKAGTQLAKVATKNKTVRMFMYAKTIADLVRDPNNTLNVFKLDDMITGSATPEQQKEFIDGLKASHPEIRQMFEERYLTPDYSLADLAIYEPGTLGYAYYHHMIDNGFSPDFFPIVKVVDDATFFTLRMRQTHDIWHVLTGYNPTVTGEIALQAFYQSQTNGLLNSMLIGAGVFHIGLFDITNMGTFLDAISEGRQRGLQARPLAPGKWETMWSRSLADVRRDYNIAPGKFAQLNLITTPTPTSVDRELAIA